MNKLDPQASQWLSAILGVEFKANKHIHSHQDEVYKIETSSEGYYLKLSKALKKERDNLKKLEKILNVPKVIGFHHAEGHDFLLISELPGKNLVELIKEWPEFDIVKTFAEAIKRLHGANAAGIFPEASPKDVLLHGDMALPNIIISEKGEIGYIDFGQLSYGSSELDLVDAIWSLQRNLGPNYGEIFLKLYGPVDITPEIREALAFRYQPAN